MTVKWEYCAAFRARQSDCLMAREDQVMVIRSDIGLVE